MSKFIVLVVLAALAAGGVYVYMNYTLQVQRDDDGRLQYVKLVPRTERPGETPLGGAAPAVAKPAVRIGSFNLTRLDQKKLASRKVAEVLLAVLPQFDVVALQDICARNQGVLVQLVDELNTATGRRYRVAAGQDFGGDPDACYSAFLFDSATIGIDHALASSVKDPAGLFRHRPLVASFRVLGPDKDLAFTFKLINVHTDWDRADDELAVLDDVYRAVRDDGSNEDDVIMLGHFGADEKHLGDLGNMLDITTALADTPTTLRTSGAVDNIVFDRRATAEFTGQAAVVDLMREFNLTMRQAADISEHMPVWAEFSSYEGVTPAHVAGKPDRIPR